MATEVDSVFVFDSAFFDEVLSDLGSLYEIASRLAYITSKATHNKKRQNKISPRSFDYIIDKHPTLNEESLRIFLNRVHDAPQLESEQDEVVRTIKYAVYSTTKWPFRATIFTSQSQHDAYRTSGHLAEVQNVSVLSKPEALAIIDQWFKKCREDKEGC